MATAKEIVAFATTLRPIMIRKPAAISPLLGHCLYEAILNAAWRVYEGERGDTVESYHKLREVLGVLSGRWAIGGVYLHCVDKYKELMYHTPLL